MCKRFSKPADFAGVLPADLSHFLQTGATHSLERAVSIIDPASQTRIDAFKRFDGFQGFCCCVRGACSDRPAEPNADEICTRCDLLVARHLVRVHRSSNAPLSAVRYRCYLGLEEMATIITVAGLPVMVVSGQFQPPEGPVDLETALSCVGRRRPGRGDISKGMWDSMQLYQYPDEFWTHCSLPPAACSHILSHVGALRPLDSHFEAAFLREAKRIAEVAQNYYDMRRARAEGEIFASVTSAVSSESLPQAADSSSSLDLVMQSIRDGLGAQYAAFFAGRTEADTLLTLRASAGKVPDVWCASPPARFNWRKARIRTGDSRDTHEQTVHWSTLSFRDSAALMRGFGRSQVTAEPLPTLIPVALQSGPFGLVALGPSVSGVDYASHESFIQHLCRDVATRLLTLQLAGILQADRADWERTSRLTGHRVRASLQNISSQLRMLRAGYAGQDGITIGEREEAERALQKAFVDLREISYAAESNVRGALDVRGVARELVPLADVIEAAALAQADVAESCNVTIELAPEIGRLPDVFGSATLLRYAFVNLINNGIKYSHPHPKTGRRTLEVRAGRGGPGEAIVEVVNFGMGIKTGDQQRIFDWGVRLAGGSDMFRDVYGKGIGLWEVKHIAEGHGGRVYATSSHFSGAEVSDEAIDRCVTVFSVVLPVG